jgi:glycosyltransferase involved in cell wall biosynthesis
LTDRNSRGDITFTYDIIAGLARRGHRLHVAAPYVQIASPMPPNLLLYELRVPGAGSILGRISYMLAVRRLYTRIRRNEPIDVIHHFSPILPEISLVLGRRRAVRILGIGATDSLSALSPGRNTAKMLTIRQGADASRFSPTPGKPSAPNVLFLGGLERRSGIFALVDAFRLIRAVLPEAVLMIAGFGGEWRSLVKAVEDADLGQCVHLLGAIPRDELPKVIQESSVLCLPSYGEHFGMVLLEAVASPRPFVPTDLDDGSHVAKAGAGKRVPALSPGTIADALLEILRPPTLADSLGRDSSRLPVESHSCERAILQLEATYYEVVARDG